MFVARLPATLQLLFEQTCNVGVDDSDGGSIGSRGGGDRRDDDVDDVADDDDVATLRAHLAAAVFFNGAIEEGCCEPRTHNNVDADAIAVGGDGIEGINHFGGAYAGGAYGGDAECQYRSGLLLAEGWLDPKEEEEEEEEEEEKEEKGEGENDNHRTTATVTTTGDEHAKKEENNGLDVRRRRRRQLRYEKSFPFFLAAALQYHGYAQLEVATDFDEGRGADHDANAAVYWFARCASSLEEVSDHALAQLERLIKEAC